MAFGGAVWFAVYAILLWHYSHHAVNDTIPSSPNITPSSEVYIPVRMSCKYSPASSSNICDNGVLLYYKSTLTKHILTLFYIPLRMPF